MSVLIKGMEKPKNCWDCPMVSGYELADERKVQYSTIRCRLTNKRRPIGEPIADDCPLVELPPHGRLIDADAAAKRGWTISRTYSASPTEMVYEARTMTDEVLPTIIEAEEGENG